MWYLIVSTPDLCNLTYFKKCLSEDWNSILIFVSAKEWLLWLMMRYFTPLIANAKNLQKVMLVSLFLRFLNDISILILNVTKTRGQRESII